MIGRGGLLGIRSQPKPPPAPRELMDRTREALPAGHRLSWGLITAGTLLEGSPYTEANEGRD